MDIITIFVDLNIECLEKLSINHGFLLVFIDYENTQIADAQLKSKQNYTNTGFCYLFIYVYTSIGFPLLTHT